MGPANRLIRLAVEAIENETVVDRSALALLPSERTDDLPAFKQLKMLPLQARLGKFFGPCVRLASLGVPFIWLGELFGSIVLHLVSGRDSVDEDATVAFSARERNRQLIESSLGDDWMNGANATKLRFVTRAEVARSLPLHEIFRCFVICIKSGAIILRKGIHPLYLYNLFGLVLEAVFVDSSPRRVIVSTSMFQHRAYLLTHLAHRCWIVQHGHISATYDFPNQFGNVERAYVFDDMQIAKYQRYYDATQWIVQPARRLKPAPFKSESVLLASSFPSTALEIEFCRELRNLTSLPIAIKLHPGHVYEPAQMRTLLTYADFVVPADADVGCTVFVSYCSAYEYHYQSAGVETYRLEGAHSMASAAAKVAEIAERSAVRCRQTKRCS